MVTPTENNNVSSNGDIQVNDKPDHPGPLDFITVPDDGHTYWQIRHDFQRSGLPRSLEMTPPFKRNAPAEERSLPEMVKIKGISSSEFEPLTRPMQLLWYKLIDKASHHLHDYVSLRRIWKDVTAEGRALTDRHSRDYGFADYIVGKNKRAKPMSIKYLACGGNLVKQLGRTRGKYGIVIEAIDIRKELPSVDELWEKPWLVQWATESTVIKLPDRTYRVSRWHWNFYNGTKYGTPFPLFSANGEYRIRQADLLPLEPGQVISPYNPESA